MKVKELISLLQKHDQNLEVVHPIYDGFNRIKSVVEIQVEDNNSKRYDFKNSEEADKSVLLLNSQLQNEDIILEDIDAICSIN